MADWLAFGSPFAVINQLDTFKGEVSFQFGIHPSSHLWNMTIAVVYNGL